MPATTLEQPSRAARLRALLSGPGLSFALEAHHALSARLVQEAGFGAVWASGLAISAQLGVRDSNEASWTQVLEVLEFMADATSIPILHDGDTGYGNFNNVRRLVRKLEQRGIAGVCIEDKLFPKTNSFLASERQPLAEVDEFCGKLKAGKDSQQDPDFCLVARTEALVTGWGMAEALRRAEAYRQAGADALLIHSRQHRPDEVLAFAREWAARLPLVVVPTSYSCHPEELERAGVRLAIWGNVMLRASLRAMQSVAGHLCVGQSLVDLEDRLAPLSEVFRLQGAQELLEAEQCYAGRSTRAVVLAATRGSGLGALTAERPKAMLSVGGMSILHRQVGELRRRGVREVTVVAGYRAEAVSLAGVRVVVNPHHEHGGELTSLERAGPHLGQDVVVLYGDLLFRGYVLGELLECEAEVAVVVDSAPGVKTGLPDHAWCSRPDDRSALLSPVRLLRMGQTAPPGDPPQGRWIGMARFRGQGVEHLRRGLAAVGSQGMPELFNWLVAQGVPVQVAYIHGHWLDVNTFEDLARADRFAHPGEGS